MRDRRRRDGGRRRPDEGLAGAGRASPRGRQPDHPAASQPQRPRPPPRARRGAVTRARGLLAAALLLALALASPAAATRARPRAEAPAAGDGRRAARAPAGLEAIRQHRRRLRPRPTAGLEGEGGRRLDPDPLVRRARLDPGDARSHRRGDPLRPGEVRDPGAGGGARLRAPARSRGSRSRTSTTTTAPRSRRTGVAKAQRRPAGRRADVPRPPEGRGVHGDRRRERRPRLRPRHGRSPPTSSRRSSRPRVRRLTRQPRSEAEGGRNVGFVAVRVDVVDGGERDVGGRRPPASIASPPPASRSRTLTTPTISSPSSRIRSIARTVEPPVVTTSSTTRHLVPGSSSGPSTQRWRPCSLRSLRTKKAIRSAPARVAERRAGERVGAHRHPADRVRAELGRALGDQLADRAVGGLAQDRPLRVDVVGGRLAARERHLAEHQRVLAKLGDQDLARVSQLRRGARLSHRRTSCRRGRSSCR